VKAIGRIVRLQVQRSSLKVVEGEAKRYDPAPIVAVDAISVTSDGAVGLPERIVDVHNASHPMSKNGGTNPLSIGFTSHYRLMRERFGPHVADGIAGENILVEADGRIRLEDDLVVVTAEGRELRLTGARVAEPCEPFTRWALRDEDGVKEGLQFLREGTRGFYLRYEGEPGVVRIGDVIYARSPAPAG
jgi:hypothetical protein